MISKVYQRGQIVIPSLLRHKYDLHVGDVVEITEEKGYLTIRKARNKGLMDLAGCIDSEKPFPTREQVRESVEKAFAGREKK